MAAEFAVTFFGDYTAATKREERFTPADLAALIKETAAPSKEALPWLKLARVGNHVSPKGSLRHDRNVIAVSGVELDYDGEVVGVDEAVETAKKAGLEAIIYSSPSHTLEKPRWRILCRTSRELPPAARALMVARVNGLYRGIFAGESFTLSQSYYYGAVDGNPDHRVEVIDGTPIDELDELDLIAIGKPHTKPGNGAGNGQWRGQTAAARKGTTRRDHDRRQLPSFSNAAARALGIAWGIDARREGAPRGCV